MVNVAGKPLLQWIVKWLRDNEVRRVILGVAFSKERIMEYFGDGKNFGVDIIYSVHTVDGGTGEGFRLAIARYVDRDTFFAMNGDQMLDLKLSDLAGFHASHDLPATMVAVSPRCPFGRVEISDEYTATGFAEKPSCAYTLCNAGIYVFSREVLGYLPGKGDIESTTLPFLARSGKLKVYPFRGSFITINTPKDLVEAEEEMRRMNQ
jgi:NDP-sugar pyrophosphorylase family protein